MNWHELSATFVHYDLSELSTLCAGCETAIHSAQELLQYSLSGGATDLSFRWQSPCLYPSYGFLFVPVTYSSAMIGAVFALGRFGLGVGVLFPFVASALMGTHASGSSMLSKIVVRGRGFEPLNPYGTGS